MRQTLYVAVILTIMSAAVCFSVGWSKAEGFSTELEDGHYDIIRVVGADPIDLERTEMVVNKVNQRLVHRFVSVTPDCFSNYSNDAKILVVTDGNCYWLTK